MCIRNGLAWTGTYSNSSMSFKQWRVRKFAKPNVSNSTHLWKSSTRITTPTCKDFLSYSKITMLVLEQQLSLSLTRDKDEAPRIVLTKMSWAYCIEHMRRRRWRSSCHSQQMRFAASSFLKLDNVGATWRIHSTYQFVYEAQHFARVNQSRLLEHDHQTFGRRCGQHQ
jgi:hypothetical protein